MKFAELFAAYFAALFLLSGFGRLVERRVNRKKHRRK